MAAEVIETDAGEEDGAEEILFDTMVRLRAIEEDEARRIVRALAGFYGFNITVTDGLEAVEG